MLQYIVAIWSLLLYCVVLIVCGIGYTQLRRHFSTPSQPSVSLTSLTESELPHVTVIRPVVGLEPRLYQCLASTFYQTYPASKLSIRFCIPSRNDLSLPILERLIADFPTSDAEILVEEEDPALRHDRVHNLGPNPKIRNMSRAYREAKGDIVWIADCNIWIGKGVAGRMVDKLCGMNGGPKQKFVHQLPLVVDVEDATSPEEASLLGDSLSAKIHSTSTKSADVRLITASTGLSGAFHTKGGRLEELFMASAHPKFYTAINTVLIAPCIIGKSSMFRRSHLDYLTEKYGSGPPGINCFSHNICEDHLIGDILWKRKVREEENGEVWGKHALLFGDLAIQPMSRMSVAQYAARRIRWLRVRKFTVLAATLIEHATESFVASLYGAFAVTAVPWFETALNIPPTWTSFATFWICSVSLWCLVDWTQYILLHSGRSIEIDDNSPDFVRPPPGGHAARRPFLSWLYAWLGREAMAFPVWAWAVFGGVTVTWRGKRFWVGVDMKVHEIKENTMAAQSLLHTNDGVNERSTTLENSTKQRRD